MKACGQKEIAFRVTAGCDRCGLYQPDEDNGELRCISMCAEQKCRDEYTQILKEEL